jgi:hypothetical protein
MPSSVSKNYKLPPTGLHTVHKMQGLILPHITVSLDSQTLRLAVFLNLITVNRNVIKTDS